MSMGQRAVAVLFGWKCMVIIALASHRPCVIDSGISTCGLSGLREEDEHPAYTAVGV